MPRKAHKRDRQIAVYTPEPLLKKLEAEAARQHRKLGPLVLVILHEWFDQNDKKQPA